MIELEQTPTGIRLPVQAQPKAKTNGLVGIHNGGRVAGKEVPRRPRLIDPLCSHHSFNHMPSIPEESDPTSMENPQHPRTSLHSTTSSLSPDQPVRDGQD